MNSPLILQSERSHLKTSVTNGQDVQDKSWTPKITYNEDNKQLCLDILQYIFSYH
jgi:hypothetical protein